MIDASTRIDPQRGGRKQTTIVVVAGLLLAALIAWATWKAVTYSSTAIKIGVKPLPALNIGKGRVWITHGENSNDWVIHSTDTAGVNMIVHRNEFLGVYTYEFQSTRLGRGGTAAVGGRGGNRVGGAGTRGQAQVSPAIAAVLSHAKELKLTEDQKTQISELDLSDFPLAAIDKTQKTRFQETAIQQWLNLLAAPDDKGKAAAEWELHGTLNSMGTKLAAYTQYPNAILDVDLCDGDNPILTPDQVVIYRKIEKQSNAPATAPANTRGAVAGARGAATAPAARGAAAGNRGAATTPARGAAANPTGNRAGSTPTNTNRTGATGRAATTPPMSAPRSTTPPASPATKPAANP